MIHIISDLPENILGISADGDITKEDYKKVLIPEIRKMLKMNKKINLLYLMGNDYTGFDLTAILDGNTAGIKHSSSWKKVALVLEDIYIDSFSIYYGNRLNHVVKLFSDDELDEAKKWIVEK
jgi:hypothetical protein